MSPRSDTSQAASSPLPPLPDINPAGQPQEQQDPMAAVLAGVTPVKAGVDQILMGCKAIVGSGAVPGAEQVCQQIIAMASALLPMAVQQMMTPQGGQQSQMPPSPQGPPTGGGIPGIGV